MSVPRKHQIWWGAMESILLNIGFPLSDGLSGSNTLSREHVMREYDARRSDLEPLGPHLGDGSSV